MNLINVIEDVSSFLMVYNTHHERSADHECLLGALGCAILPKVLEEISPMPNPIPIPMNVSPSEKKSNFLHV